LTEHELPESSLPLKQVTQALYRGASAAPHRKQIKDANNNMIEVFINARGAA
jgi:hypothetical protein